MENQNVAPRTERVRAMRKAREEGEGKTSIVKKTIRLFTSAFVLAILSGIVYISMNVIPNTLVYWTLISHRDQAIHVLYTLQQVNKDQGEQGLTKVLAAYNK